jgi:transposase
VAALETENAALVLQQIKLATERDILGQAAKYFAGETHW